MEELERFTKDMEKNENFKSEFLNYVEELKKNEPEISKKEAIEKFAKEKGYVETKFNRRSFNIKRNSIIM